MHFLDQCYHFLLFPAVFLFVSMHFHELSFLFLFLSPKLVWCYVKHEILFRLVDLIFHLTIIFFHFSTQHFVSPTQWLPHHTFVRFLMHFDLKYLALKDCLFCCFLVLHLIPKWNLSFVLDFFFFIHICPINQKSDLFGSICHELIMW